MSATYPTATLGGGPDFRRNVTTYPGWSGDRTARYVGRCVLCGVRTFDDTVDTLAGNVDAKDRVAEVVESHRSLAALARR